MYYPMSNFVPWRDSAWAVLAERVRVLADRCDAVTTWGDVPSTIAGVAATARAIAVDLAAHVPPELCPTRTPSELRRRSDGRTRGNRFLEECSAPRLLVIQRAEGD